MKVRYLGTLLLAVLTFFGCDDNTGTLGLGMLPDSDGMSAHTTTSVSYTHLAGLSFAGDMAKYGYDVTVFEALHEIGGVWKYGIPEFRLPNKVVDVEIDNLAKMGGEFVKDCIIGKTLSVEQLEEEGFKGIFVASGARCV